MSKMGFMKDLSDKFKLSVRSLGEIHERLNAMVSKFKTTGEVLFQGKSTKEGIVNSAVLYIDSLPHEQRVAVLRIGTARLEALLRGEDITRDSLDGQDHAPTHFVPHEEEVQADHQFFYGEPVSEDEGSREKRRRG